MLYSLDWLAQGRMFPPPSERDRIKRYRENEMLFDGDHFSNAVFRHRSGTHAESIQIYSECARRISRVIGNFENIISFPVLLNYQRLMSVKMADLVCGEFPSITGASKEENKKLKETYLRRLRSLD